MAAYNAGVKTVLLPEENLRDLYEIDPLAKEGLRFIPCKVAKDVLTAALLPCAKEPKEELLSEESGASLMVPQKAPQPTVRCSDPRN